MKKKAQTILPWSLHKGTGWKTQYEQMKRWYFRVNSATEKMDITDYLFAFYQSCYHLRDWLVLTSEVTKEDLDRFIALNEELRICRDICNVTKHFSISSPSQDFELSFVQEYCDPSNPYHRDCWYGGNAKLTIVNDDKNYDARELAHRCLSIWHDYLRERKMLEDHE